MTTSSWARDWCARYSCQKRGQLATYPACAALLAWERKFAASECGGYEAESTNIYLGRVSSLLRCTGHTVGVRVAGRVGASRATRSAHSERLLRGLRLLVLLALALLTLVTLLVLLVFVVLVLLLVLFDVLLLLHLLLLLALVLSLLLLIL